MTGRLEGFASGRVHRNLSTAHLCELALARQEGQLSADGALVCLTGPHTGRSPRDKFIVREPSSDAHLWWGSVNRPLEESHFAALEHDVTDYLRGRDLFVQDLAGGADPGFRLPVRVVTELAWHSLFARNLLLDSGAANGHRRSRSLRRPASRRRRPGTARARRPAS